MIRETILLFYLDTAFAIGWRLPCDHAFLACSVLKHPSSMGEVLRTVRAMSGTLSTRWNSLRRSHVSQKASIVRILG